MLGFVCVQALISNSAYDRVFIFLMEISMATITGDSGYNVLSATEASYIESSLHSLALA